MSYLVLARRWRPQTFEQIRGQEHIVRALRNAISSGRIAHAYVFTGIRGVGKTSAARVLSKALNCVHGPTPTPCNECEECRAITDGKSPDVLEIDGASNTGVEDVRKLREAVRYPPVRGHYRIYIIDEVHMLSTAAFNALLKTLEEPPPHVVFVFATTDAHKIPITILSRCQQFDFKRLSPRELMTLLRDVAAAEGLQIDDKSLVALAREADGSVRDAQSLLDQVISYCGQTIRYADVRDVLGVVDRDLLLGVARTVVQREPRAVLEHLVEAERFGYDVRRFALDLQDVFRDLAVLKAVEGADDLLELAPEEAAEARQFLGDTPWEEIHALFDMLSRGVETLRSASRPAVALEMTLLKMAKMPPILPLSQMLAAAAAAPLRAPAPRSAAEAPQAVSLEGKGPSRRAREELRKVLGPSPGTQQETPRRQAGQAGDAGDAPPQPQGAPTAEAPGQLAPPTTGQQEAMDPEALWAALLGQVERASRPFWSVLKGHGKLASWDPARKLAVVSCDDPSQAFLWRPKADVLTSALQAIVGPGAAAEIRIEAAAGEKARDAAAESDRARSFKKEAMEHPLVREALDLFDAAVEEVRALKP